MKCTPVLIIYLSVKFLTTPIIISERLVLPQYDYNEDARHTPYLDNIREKLRGKYCPIFRCW